MKSLKLDLVMKVTVVKRDESIPMQLSLLNSGSDNVEVPGNDGPTQFEYLLLDETGSKTVLLLSHGKMELLKAGGLVPRAVLKTQTLPPNRLQVYTADLAKLLIEPVAPAKYKLQALYRTNDQLYRSNIVDIEFSDRAK